MLLLCSRKSKEVRVTEGSKQLRVIEEAIDGRLGHPQVSLAIRGEDWASQGQPKGKAEIPVVTRVN